MRPTAQSILVLLLLAAAWLGSAAEPERGEGPALLGPKAPGWDRRLSELVSPGPLAEAHLDLEGVTRCSECHTWLGGTPDAPCLACHEAVGARMDAGLGFHGGLEGSCSSCHSDHRGLDADLLGLDREGFAHDQALYVLRGAHLEVACADCHLRPHPETGREAFRPILWPAVPARSQPGAACADCHEDPHGERLVRERACEACHVDAGWKAPAAAASAAGRGFDHDADTRFALDAVHEPVACGACHRPELETPPARECGACHGDAVALLSGRLGGAGAVADPHFGTTECRDCHPAAMAPASLPAYATACTACHPASYASLLATRRALLDEALVAAHPVAKGAEERRLLERLIRSGLHHPELAEALAHELAR